LVITVTKNKKQTYQKLSVETNEYHDAQLHAKSMSKKHQFSSTIILDMNGIPIEYWSNGKIIQQ